MTLNSIFTLVFDNSGHKSTSSVQKNSLLLTVLKRILTRLKKFCFTLGERNSKIIDNKISNSILCTKKVGFLIPPVINS